MLDYILSRLVLLAFLFLLLGLLVSYQDLLGRVFLGGAAKGVATNIGEQIRSIALNLTISAENRKIRLPNVLQAGPLRVGYKVRFGCVKKGADKAILGIAILNPRGTAVYVYRVDIYLPGKTVKISYPKGDVSSGSILEIQKDLTVNEMTLNIYNCGKDPSCSEIDESSEVSCS